MQFDTDVCALLDAAGLDARFRTIDEHAGGATASYCAADLTPDALHEQFVLENRPVILRDLHPGWTPHSWNDAHVRASCGDRSISVRCADAAARFGDPGSSGMYTRKQLRVEEFLDSLADASASEGSPYYAAQLSLRRDLPELFADTLPEPPHLRAFGPLWRGSPAAYIGGATRTPLHFDAFENLLCVVRGAKSVQLWPPGCAPLLYPGGGESALFSRADIFEPDLQAWPLLERALPLALRAHLGPGDALYLPCGWWHAVQTTPPPNGEAAMSISYWARQPDGKVARTEGGEAVF